jgi:CHASE2 domain-containing sensor protein
VVTIGSRTTAKQRAAARALVVQLGLALSSTGLAAGYVVTDSGWIPPVAGAALIATAFSSVITRWRIREEAHEDREVERALRGLE